MQQGELVNIMIAKTTGCDYIYSIIMHIKDIMWMCTNVHQPNSTESTIYTHL